MLFVRAIEIRLGRGMMFVGIGGVKGEEETSENLGNKGLLSRNRKKSKKKGNAETLLNQSLYKSTELSL